MIQFAAYTIIGLSLGGIFALAALGIVLIYRVTGVLNFAHGAMGMFSTFVAWQVFYGMPHTGMAPWMVTAEAIGAGLLFAVLLGLVLELAVFRWVRNRPQITKAVITIGVLLALQSAASLIWKNNQYHLPIYLAPQTSTFKIADVPIGANYIVIVVVALGLAFGLAAFLRSTAFGRAMRAVSDDPTAASPWGVRVDMVGAVSWMLGSLIAALAIIWGFGILSLVLLTGYAGQVSLCQATFAGVAAYGAGMTVASMHGGYLLGIVVGVLAATVLGVIVGLPALRLHGITLAIVTLGIALVFDKYVFQDHIFDWFTGGTGGWQVTQASLFGIPVDSSKHLLTAYDVMLALFCVVAVLMVNLHQSGAGRRFRAIRDSELAASTMGVNLTRYKLLAFAISAGIAGLGGSFYPLVAGSVSPQPFWVFTSLQLAAIGVLMGVRYVPAAALGGVFMAVVPDVLTRYGHGTFMNRFNYDISYDWFQIAVGVLLILQLILLPDGVWGDMRAKLLHARGAAQRKPAREAPA